MIDLLPPAPFYITINQLLDARFYANNSFYVSGTDKLVELENTFSVATGAVQYIDLPVRVRDQKFVRLYVDGVEKSAGQFTLNKNSTYRDNVAYTTESTDITYRV